jgi:hypothetical protein
VGAVCGNPYSASIFNISAMSFGSLSANAILALNKGAKLGGFAQDTGEGSISRYHRGHGAGLIWELGSGYFGCRTADGHFDPAGFEEKARLEQVRMISPGSSGDRTASTFRPTRSTAASRLEFRHCEERSDEAIQFCLRRALDCFASPAMTNRCHVTGRRLDFRGGRTPRLPPPPFPGYFR